MMAKVLLICHQCMRYSKSTKYRYAYLKATLQKKVNVHGLEAHPFDIPAIVNTISDGLAEIPTLSSRSLVFNVTGGTKPMSLATYQVALQWNAPEVSMRKKATLSGGQTQSVSQIVLEFT